MSRATLVVLALCLCVVAALHQEGRVQMRLSNKLRMPEKVVQADETASQNKMVAATLVQKTAPKITKDFKDDPKMTIMASTDAKSKKNVQYEPVFLEVLATQPPEPVAEAEAAPQKGGDGGGGKLEGPAKTFKPHLLAEGGPSTNKRSGYRKVGSTMTVKPTIVEGNPTSIYKPQFTKKKSKPSSLLQEMSSEPEYTDKLLDDTKEATEKAEEAATAAAVADTPKEAKEAADDAADAAAEAQEAATNAEDKAEAVGTKEAAAAAEQAARSAEQAHAAANDAANDAGNHGVVTGVAGSDDEKVKAEALADTAKAKAQEGQKANDMDEANDAAKAAKLASDKAEVMAKRAGIAAQVTQDPKDVAAAEEASDAEDEASEAASDAQEAAAEERLDFSNDAATKEEKAKCSGGGICASASTEEGKVICAQACHKKPLVAMRNLPDNCVCAFNKDRAGTTPQEIADYESKKEEPRFYRTGNELPRPGGKWNLDGEKHKKAAEAKKKADKAKADKAKDAAAAAEAAE